VKAGGKCEGVIDVKGGRRKGWSVHSWRSGLEEEEPFEWWSVVCVEEDNDEVMGRAGWGLVVGVAATAWDKGVNAKAVTLLVEDDDRVLLVRRSV